MIILFKVSKPEKAKVELSTNKLILRLSKEALNIKSIKPKVKVSSVQNIAPAEIEKTEYLFKIY